MPSRAKGRPRPAIRAPGSAQSWRSGGRWRWSGSRAAPRRSARGPDTPSRQRPARWSGVAESLPRQGHERWGSTMYFRWWIDERLSYICTTVGSCLDPHHARVRVRVSVTDPLRQGRAGRPCRQPMGAAGYRSGRGAQQGTPGEEAGAAPAQLIKRVMATPDALRLAGVQTTGVIRQLC